MGWSDFDKLASLMLRQMGKGSKGSKGKGKSGKEDKEDKQDHKAATPKGRGRAPRQQVPTFFANAVAKPVM